MIDKKGYGIKDIFNIYKKSNVNSAKSFVDTFSSDHKLSVSEKNYLIALFKQKGAKM
jgi:hypothetical protein